MSSCLHRIACTTTLAAVLAVAGLLVGAAAAASAAPSSSPRAARVVVPTPVSGRAWTVPVVRLYDTTPRAYREGIDIAIRSWNEARIGIRFARTTNRSVAHVVIGTARYSGDVAGRATVGMTRGAWLRLDTALVAVEPEIRNGVITNLPGSAVPESIASVAAHELGHVLGLMHTRGCSLMGTSGTTGCRFNPPSGKWACRMQQQRDVLAMARRYGGTGIVRAGAYCRLSATSAGPVRALVATASTRSAATTLDWRPSTNSYGYVIARSAAGAACPAAPAVGALRRDLVDSSYDEAWGTADTPLVAARYCYAIWSRNGRGTLTGPARVFVDVVPPAATPVTNLQATVAGSTVQFTWTSSADTRVVRIYRSDQPGATSCAVPAFLPIAVALGTATSASEASVPSGTWTYAVTRSNDPDDDGESDGASQWVSAPDCVTVTVP